MLLITKCKHKKILNTMDKRILHPDVYLGATLVLFIIILITLLAPYLDTLLPQKIACTEEAKICPDGSAVGRTGPTCAFTPCPNDNLPNRPGITEDPFIITPTPPTTQPKTPILIPKNTRCTQDAKMCSDGSFVSRVAPNCDYAPCPSDTEREY